MLSVTNQPFMLGVIMLNVLMLSVVALLPLPWLPWGDETQIET